MHLSHRAIVTSFFFYNHEGIEQILKILYTIDYGGLLVNLIISTLSELIDLLIGTQELTHTAVVSRVANN